MTYESIYNSLPTSWENMTYSQYQKVIDVPIADNGDDFDNITNSFRIISSLTGTSTEALEALPLAESIVLIKRINFISTEPDIKNYKSKLQWKNIESITYDDFVTLVTLSQDSIHNMGAIIKNFTVNKLTDEEVSNLSMMELHSGFFLLKKIVKRYINRTSRRTSKQLIILSIKETLALIKRKLQKRKTS